MQLILTLNSSSVAAALVLAVRPAVAQSPPHPPAPVAAAPTPPPAEPEDEPGVRVVGTGARALDRVPGAVSVATEQDLRRAQPLSPNEALRDVPGLHVRDEDGMGLRPNISMRGLDPTRSRLVMVLEDGIPVSLAPYSEPELYYNPPIERMARIEVIRGSGNILFGPQTIGGVVNYVTANPPVARTWSLRTTFGDRNYFSAFGQFGDRFENAAFTVSLLRRQGDGFRHMHFEVNDAYGKFQLRLGPRSEILVRLGFYDEGSATTYLGLTQSMFDADPNQNPAANDWFRVRRYSASIVHNWTPDRRVNLRTAIYGYVTDRDWAMQQYDRDPVANLQYAYIAGDPHLARGAIYLRDAATMNNRHYEVFGIEPRLQARFATGRFRHETDAGARFLVERAVLQVLTSTRATDRSGSLVADEQRDDWAFAAYVQHRFFATSHLQITPAVRLETYDYTRLVRRSDATEVFFRGHGHNTQLIPGLSVSYGTPAVTAFVDAHLGYSPPRISASITSTGHDVMLAAEQSINSEIGARFAVGRWLKGEAAVFYINFLNEIIQVSGSESEFANGGPARHVGAEASGEIDFGRLARVPTSVYLSARYTFVDARLIGGDFDGHFVPYAVPHSLNIHAGFEHPLGLAAQASWTFASDHFSDRANTPSGTADGLFGPIPAYNTFDLTARYQHRPTGLGVSVSAKNVQGYALDARGRQNVYIASRSPEGIFPGGFGQVMVTLRWEHE